MLRALFCTVVLLLLCLSPVFCVCTWKDDHVSPNMKYVVGNNNLILTILDLTELLLLWIC